MAIIREIATRNASIIIPSDSFWSMRISFSTPKKVIIILRLHCKKIIPRKANKIVVPKDLRSMVRSPRLAPSGVCPVKKITREIRIPCAKSCPRIICPSALFWLSKMVYRTLKCVHASKIERFTKKRISPSKKYRNPDEIAISCASIKYKK